MAIFSFLTNLFSDVYKNERGYLRYKDSGKFVHRYVAEKKLGRKLRPEEVVHHIDRDKTNNSRENLWVFKNQAEHDKTHKYDAKRFGKEASYKGFNQKKKKGFWDMF